MFSGVGPAHLTMNGVIGTIVYLVLLGLIVLLWSHLRRAQEKRDEGEQERLRNASRNIGQQEYRSTHSILAGAQGGAGANGGAGGAGGGEVRASGRAAMGVEDLTGGEALVTPMRRP